MGAASVNSNYVLKAFIDRFVAGQSQLCLSQGDQWKSAAIVVEWGPPFSNDVTSIQKSWCVHVVPLVFHVFMLCPSNIAEEEPNSAPIQPPLNFIFQSNNGCCFSDVPADSCFSSNCMSLDSRLTDSIKKPLRHRGVDLLLKCQMCLLWKSVSPPQKAQ